ncbi:MAG: DNA gyrase modulator, partial [Acidobacteriota bacterium]
MTMLEPGAARQILDRMLAGGGDHAEVYLEERVGTAIHLDDGRIEEVIAGHDRGAALRLVDGDRTLFASTNRADVSGLEEAADRLTASRHGAAPSQAAPFRPSRGGTPPPVLRPPGEVPLGEKVEVLHRA